MNDQNETINESQNSEAQNSGSDLEKAIPAGVASAGEEDQNKSVNNSINDQSKADQLPRGVWHDESTDDYEGAAQSELQPA